MHVVRSLSINALNNVPSIPHTHSHRHAKLQLPHTSAHSHTHTYTHTYTHIHIYTYRAHSGCEALVRDLKTAEACGVYIHIRMRMYT
jgi:hypothetical protein